MNREIKEILDNTLEYLEGIDETRNTKILTTNETKILLDYITNLQERLDRIDLVNCKLRKENDRLKEILHWKQIENNLFYKSRIDKAVELINKRKEEEDNGIGCVEMRTEEYFEECDELINILKGSDE